MGVKYEPIENPFYHNYVFKDRDIKRGKVSVWEYPILLFLSTYVQLTENYAIFYKAWGGRYYIVGFEKWGVEGNKMLNTTNKK